MLHLQPFGSTNTFIQHMIHQIAFPASKRRKRDSHFLRQIPKSLRNWDEYIQIFVGNILNQKALQFTISFFSTSIHIMPGLAPYRTKPHTSSIKNLVNLLQQLRGKLALRSSVYGPTEEANIKVISHLYYRHLASNMRLLLPVRLNLMAKRKD